MLKNGNSDRMSMFYLEPLPPSTRLLYAQLLETLDLPAAPSRDLRFYKKTDKGREYWIRRVQIGETTREISLGPATRELDNLIEEEKLKAAENKEETSNRETLVNALLAAGATPIDTTFMRILLLLENARVFQVGGVLTGSHAFVAYGNMLGYRFKSAITRTADIDLGFDDAITVGITKQPALEETITKADLDMLSVPGLDPASPTTSFKMKGREFRVDLITDMKGTASSRPRYIAAIKSYAAPVRYLEYLLTDPVDTILVAGPGIKVKVPGPGRYAIHKLMLARRRPATQQAKAVKDLNQAACLVKILSQDRPWELQEAMDAAKSYNKKKFMDYVAEGFQSLMRIDEYKGDSDIQSFVQILRH